MTHHAIHRPRHPVPGAIALQEQAYRAFARWCAEHDPDGEMDIFDAKDAYSLWSLGVKP